MRDAAAGNFANLVRVYCNSCYPRARRQPGTLHDRAMDQSWEHFTKMRAYHEFSFRSADIVQAAEDHGKRIADRFWPLLLKVRPTAPFTAFRFNASPPLYITTAHGIPEGATHLDAVNWEGTTGMVTVKCNGTEHGMDIAVLEASSELVLPDQPVNFAPTYVGSTCYLLAFGGDEHVPHFTSGSITSLRTKSCSTSAYADHGFSGGPAVNVHGDVVGMVQRGDVGITNKQTLLIDASSLMTFLTVFGFLSSGA